MNFPTDEQFRRFLTPAPGEECMVCHQIVPQPDAPLITYTLQLFGPEDGIRAFAPSALRETEENLTDLLPAGYEVRIRDWDAEEEK